MQNSQIEPAFSLDVDDVLGRQDVALESGLSEADVTKRRETHGLNELTEAKRISAFAILVHQFSSVIVWLLAAGAALSLYLGDLAEAVAIILVLLINGAIGFVTELRAIKSMEALRHIARVKTRVRRDSAETTIDARDLVPGDIVLLREGDVVTADIRLVDVSDLHCDESVLTGESVPVVKAIDPLPTETTLGDRVNMAFKGSAVSRGRGEGVVVATGMETQLGQISDLAQSATAEVAPLERRLDRLGHRLVYVTLALAAFTILAGILRGYDLAAMIETGIALAVAAVPEGLPIVATLTLARGMWRMAARNALISNMPSVETLGATTVILTDKTGTLTENRMTAVRYLLAEGDVAVEIAKNEAQFSSDDRTLDPAADPALASALRIGALCNSASLDVGGQDDASGDPMERALLVVAQAAGLDDLDARRGEDDFREYPFDPDLKMMATAHDTEDGVTFAIKGAPEAVIERCTHVVKDETGSDTLNDTDRQDWMTRAEAAASEGLRLLALASKTENDKDAEPYENLTLTGIVCLLDPIRAEIPEAIRQARKAGVRVIMMTGDHADTAATIAKRAGLADGEIVVREGADIGALDGMSADDESGQAILKTDVFARVEPETKLKLAALFQKSGEIVAMTGDGVNDAPALKKADIGIAMGQRGTEVAREAADMVLKDDNFATIIDAMRQGRVIFGNIRNFVVYLMSCNVSEILVVGLAVGAGLPAPLLPLQILFLNLVTDVFPAFALGLGQGEEGVMDRPPRDPQEGIVARDQWILIGVLGGLITVLTLGAFMLALFWLDLTTADAVTVAFLTLALAQLWNVFNVRDIGRGIVVNEVTVNPYVWGALALCLALLAAALWLPGLSDILQLQDPGPAGLGLAFGASVAHFALGQALLALGVGHSRVPLSS